MFGVWFPLFLALAKPLSLYALVKITFEVYVNFEQVINKPSLISPSGKQQLALTL
jgi:hypothetical protein